MKGNWLLVQVVAGAMGLNLLTGCGGKNEIPQGSLSLVPSDTNGNSRPEEMKKLGEGTTPIQGHQVKLQKSFWVGKRIWVSWAVERSTLDGLAMSVLGYIPVELEKNGDELILKRDTQGLYNGTILAPELPLNSYPIVAENDQDMVVDLSKPKSPYGISLSGLDPETATASDVKAVGLTPEFEYLKSAEVNGNRVSFESVMTLKSDDKKAFENAFGMSPQLVSMNIRTDWVTQIEDPEYKGLVNQDGLFGFFLSSPLNKADGARKEQYVNRISTHHKFTWEISAETPAAFRDSIKQGILAWNDALGSDTLEVRLADGKKSHTDPSASNVVWDDSLNVGYAFANFRSNPYTGQIVQAQVYIPGKMWALTAAIEYQLRRMDEKAHEAAPPARPRPAGLFRFFGMDSMTTTHEGLTGQPTETHNLLGEDASGRLLGTVRSELEKAAQNQAPKRFFFGPSVDTAAEKARSRDFCVEPLSHSKELVEELAKQGDFASLIPYSPFAGDEDPTTQPSTQPSQPATQPSQPATQPSTQPTTQPAAQPAAVKLHVPYPAKEVTAEEFAKNTIRAVIMHEVGHTLGLRHNFMGSLGESAQGKIHSGSIMDYNDSVIDTEFTQVGDFDKTLVSAVYHEKFNDPDLADMPFCTDEDRLKGAPDCYMKDFGDEPVDSLRATEESDLKLAHNFLAMGNQAGLFLLSQSLENVMSLSKYVVTPTPTLFGFVDKSTSDRQTKAWAGMLESKTMLGMDYPEKLKALYASMVTIVLAKSVSPTVQGSVLANNILTYFSDALLDKAGTEALPSRMGAVAGLKNIGSPEARNVLAQLETELSKLDSSKRSLEVRMNDGEVLTQVKKVLASGFYTH